MLIVPYQSALFFLVVIVVWNENLEFWFSHNITKKVEKVERKNKSSTGIIWPKVCIGTLKPWVYTEIDVFSHFLYPCEIIWCIGILIFVLAEIILDLYSSCMIKDVLVIGSIVNLWEKTCTLAPMFHLLGYCYKNK